MNELDWLRLGGIIAERWPIINFGTVTIKSVNQAFCEYCIPLIKDGLSEEAIDDLLADEMIEFEYEHIRLEKVIIKEHAVRIGYGPKSELLLINIDKQQK